MLSLSLSFSSRRERDQTTKLLSLCVCVSLRALVPFFHAHPQTSSILSFSLSLFLSLASSLVVTTKTLKYFCGV